MNKYILKTNTIFKNKTFQRFIYLIILLLWLFRLSNDFENLNSQSSIGVSYAILIFPFSFILITQIIINNKIIWQFIRLIFLIISLFILCDNFTFYKNYQNKTGYKEILIWESEFILLIVVIITNYVIYKIKPTSRSSKNHIIKI